MMTIRSWPSPAAPNAPIAPDTAAIAFEPVIKAFTPRVAKLNLFYLITRDNKGVFTQARPSAAGGDRQLSGAMARFLSDRSAQPGRFPSQGNALADPDISTSPSH